MALSLKGAGETKELKASKVADYHQDHESEEKGKDMHIPRPDEKVLILLLAAPVVIMVLTVFALFYIFS